MSNNNKIQTTKSGIVHSIIPDDNNPTVLKFLNDQDEPIASYDYDNHTIKIHKEGNVLYYLHNTDQEGVCIVEHNCIPFTGKGLFIGDTTKKQIMYAFPFSDNLYQKVMQKLELMRKQNLTNFDYCKALCATVVQEMGKEEQKKQFNNNITKTIKNKINNNNLTTHKTIKSTANQISTIETAQSGDKSSNQNTTVITNSENRNSNQNTTVTANGNNCNNTNNTNANTNDNKDTRPKIEAWMILLCFVVVGFIFVIMTKLKQNEYDKEHNKELYNLDSGKQEIKR